MIWYGRDTISRNLNERYQSFLSLSIIVFCSPCNSGSVHLDTSKVFYGLAHFQEFLVLPGALLLINHDMISHEPQESCRVIRRRHSGDARPMPQYRELQEVLQLLVEIVVLQVVDNANVVDIATTCAQELVSIALEARTDKCHFFIAVDGA